MKREFKKDDTQTVLVFKRETYLFFKSRCIQRATSVNRVIEAWVEKQVATWRQEEAKRAALAQGQGDSP